MNIQFGNKFKNKKIVCLGGGIGTVNLLRGLRRYSDNITVISSMADEGGSSGRLRRLYNVMPAGDIISCFSSLASGRNKSARILTYRFPGNRYGSDNELAGHKLGNLMLIAAEEVTGSFEKAIDLMQNLFSIPGNIIPATLSPVSLLALTVDGVVVKGEENVDLGKYKGNKVLKQVSLLPRNTKVNPKALKALKQADIIIAGPGDLYTTILPVLIIPEIAAFLRTSKKPAFYIINVANKPYETRGYAVSDFVRAVTKHLGNFPFKNIVVNGNFSQPIPKPFHYTYVKTDPAKINPGFPDLNIIKADLADKHFPLYHDPDRLAATILKNMLKPRTALRINLAAMTGDLRKRLPSFSPGLFPG